MESLHRHNRFRRHIHVHLQGDVSKHTCMCWLNLLLHNDPCSSPWMCLCIGSTNMQNHGPLPYPPAKIQVAGAHSFSSFTTKTWWFNCIIQWTMFIHNHLWRLHLDQLCNEKYQKAKPKFRAMVEAIFSLIWIFHPSLLACFPFLAALPWCMERKGLWYLLA